MLDYNFLTSPKKLIEYQKLYFEDELIQNDVKNLNWFKIENNEIFFEKITKEHD